MGSEVEHGNGSAQHDRPKIRMVPHSMCFQLPDPVPLTFEEANGDYKIVQQLQCQRNEVAVEVKGKNVVRITTTEGGNVPTVHEALLPEDVKLERTAAVFNAGTLTVTVPKRAPGCFAGCAKRGRRLNRTSIPIT